MNQLFPPTSLHRRWFSIVLRSALLLNLLFLGLPPSPAAQAEVIISEIMYNPDGTDLGVGFNREWIEIYNTGGSSVDLGGWIFEDFQDMTPADPIPNGTSIGAGEALVLVGDAQAFDSQWGNGINRMELGNFPTLANSPTAINEILFLRNSLSTVIDSVNYDDSNGWPTDSPDGPSIYVLPDSLTALANNDGTNWARSSLGVYGAYLDGMGGVESSASPGVVATQTTNFDPSPDAAWSMVFFPDTQNYVKSQNDIPHLTTMTEWVRDNRAAWNVQVVLQGGDVVNKNSNENPSSGENASTLQWQNAQAAMGILNGEVPYIMSAGNHDFGTNNAEDRTTRLNDFFFATDNPLIDPAQGGILKGVRVPGRLENAYYELTAPDGRELLIFSLEWGPRQLVVNWANQIAAQPEYADHTAVLLTHAYMHHDGTRYDWNRNLDADPNNDQKGNPHDDTFYATANDPDGTHDGEELWNELVKQNGNFELVFNGHIGGDGTGNLSSTSDAGHDVQQMGFNTQFQVEGGTSWIRVLEFLDDGKTVRVRTYSPSLDFVRTDPENEFFFELEPLLPPGVNGDYNNDGVVDAADYTAWLDNLGSVVALPNDNNLGTPVGQSHYDLWKANFGNTTVAATTVLNGPAVPEPNCLILIVTLLFGPLLNRQLQSACCRLSLSRQ